MAYQPPLNGGRINASIGGNTAGASTLISTGTMVLAGGNNIALSQNANTITINGGAGRGIGLSAGTQSVSTGTMVFSNSNGVTFGMSGSSRITASVATNYAASNHSHGNPTLNLTNLSGTTASASNGLTLSLSAAAPGGGAGLSAGTQSVNTGTVNFANSNGITFGMSGSNQITASHNGLTSQSVQTQGLQSVTIGSNTAGVGAAISSGQMTLAGGNNITLSQNGGNAVTIHGAGGGVGGGIALANSNTTITSGTAQLSVSSGALTISGNGQTMNFAAPNTSSLSVTGAISLSTNGNTINIGAPEASVLSATGAVSISTNGNTISIGVPTNAGGGATYSYFSPQDAYLQVVSTHGNGTLHLQPTPAPNVTFDRIVFPINFTGTSNVTATISLSMMLGVYTKTGSTLSLLTGFTGMQVITHSGNVNSTLNNGMRLMTIGASSSLSEGQYVIGVLSRSSTAGGNVSISQILASQLNSNFGGILCQASNASIQYTRGLGYYSASTSALPNSLGYSQIQGTNSNALRQPLIYFINGTV